jgi:putative ABC transport system ATP-binding protein
VNNPDSRTAGDAVRLNAVRKVYGKADNSVVALDGVTIGFERNTFTAVMGPSGSGKSTLLHCASGIDRPTSGSVVLDGRELTELNETALTKLRRERVGFVFQAYNLLPALTVLQNITLPLRLAGRQADQAKLTTVVERVGLDRHVNRRPSELSGGQQQRVAIARALVTEPVAVFADEPTGALDSHTSLEVLDLLGETVRQAGQTVVMVTHDPLAATSAERVVFLADGQVVNELSRPTVEAISDQMTQLAARAHRRAQPTPPTMARGV